MINPTNSPSYPEMNGDMYSAPTSTAPSNAQAPGLVGPPVPAPGPFPGNGKHLGQIKNAMRLPFDGSPLYQYLINRK